MTDNIESLENFILKNILNAPLVEEILVYNQQKNEFYIGGQVISNIRANELITSAKTLQQLELFQLLLKSMVHLGQQKVSIDSKGWEDVRFGKALLYTADIIKKKVDNLAAMPLRKVTK